MPVATVRRFLVDHGLEAQRLPVVQLHTPNLHLEVDVEEAVGLGAYTVCIDARQIGTERCVGTGQIQPPRLYVGPLLDLAA